MTSRRSRFVSFVGVALICASVVAHAAGSLDTWWSRPGTTPLSQLVPPPLAPALGKRPTTATRPRFDAKLAARRQAPAILDAAQFNAERARVASRLATIRHLDARQKRDLASLGVEARTAYLDLLARCPDARIAWDGAQPLFLRGSSLAAAASGEPDIAARAFWTYGAPLFGLRAEDLEFVRSERDALGMTQVRFRQVFEGHEVWAHDAIVHVRADGNVDAVNGRLAPAPLELAGAIPQLDGATAAARAASSGATATHAATPGPRAIAQDVQVFITPDGTAHLAWRVRVEHGLDAIEDVFVDARDGQVLHRTSRVATDGPVSGSGVDLAGQTRALGLYQVGTNFFNINASKPMFNAAASTPPQTVVGGIRIFDAQHGMGEPLFFSASTNANAWPGRAADVSAAFHASIVYDYFNQRHMRNSIDAGGGTLELIVNFQSNFNNAFWNGQFMVFGNGDGNQFGDLAGALDVTAHEMTHGVVERTANLVYELQPGALNESFADVFGACTEFFARPTTANWLLGEEVTTPSIGGDCLRNMENPAAANVAFGGQQPTRMAEFRNLPNTPDQDHGGVHINSGITNRAFYLVANDTRLGGTQTERIGKAERIYYRALTQYLTRSSQFVDCRLGVIRAAEDLFGAGGVVAVACGDAFDTVEITSGDPTDPPDDLPPVIGAEYLAVTDAGNGQLLRMTLDLLDVRPLSSVAIHNKPAITRGTGSQAYFIDSTFRLRTVTTNGTLEMILSDQPVWWSVAIAPDESKLAATTADFDGKIYIFDLNDPMNDTVYDIYSQNYGGEGNDAALFADFLEFSNDGAYVLYDAFNVAVSAGGDSIGYWDINVLRAADGNILRVFPPDPSSDIGNPTFSPVSDLVIAFDYVDANGDVQVLGADLENGTVGVITFNAQSPGRPTFAPPANQVAYHYIDQVGASLWTVSLLADGITGSGNDAQVATGGYDPVWFAIGSRPAVTLSALGVERIADSARLEWEARTDAAWSHFRILRDVGDGFASRGEPITEAFERGAAADRYWFTDDLRDLPADIEQVRYAVQSVDGDGASVVLGSITLELTAAPPRFVRLAPNVPNPFNPSTAMHFTLGRTQPARLEILDTAGRGVRTVWQGRAVAGAQARVWDGRNAVGVPVAAGIYFARLVAEDGTRTRKITLVK